jgi:hypothetical protein
MVDFAKSAGLPVINENCPACFKEPKKRARVKKLLSNEVMLYPQLYDNIRKAILPLMHDEVTAIMRCLSEEFEERTRKQQGKHAKNKRQQRGEKGMPYKGLSSRWELSHLEARLWQQTSLSQTKTSHLPSCGYKLACLKPRQAICPAMATNNRPVSNQDKRSGYYSYPIHITKKPDYGNKLACLKPRQAICPSCGYKLACLKPRQAICPAMAINNQPVLNQDKQSGMLTG